MDTIKLISQNTTNLQQNSFNPPFPINYCLNDDCKTSAELTTILLSITNYTIWQLRIRGNEENLRPRQKDFIARIYNNC